MSSILNPYFARLAVEGLELTGDVSGLLQRILGLADKDGRVQVTKVGKLFPLFEARAINNAINRLVELVNKTAKTRNVPLTMQIADGGEDRWLWFEGPELPSPPEVIDTIPDHEYDQREGFRDGGLPRILLLTFNEFETRAVTKRFCSGQPTETLCDGVTYHYLGIHGGARIFHRVSQQGEANAQQSTTEGIRALKPRAVIGVGIAFGVNEESQHIGDVLVARSVQGYNLAKVGTTDTKLRESNPPASRLLVNRLDHLVQQTPCDGTNAWPRVILGILISGDRLVDNLDYRNDLIKLTAREIIGGDMEATGIQTAAHAEDVHWIIVKAICDFADGNKSNDKESNQKLAAANAAHVVYEALTSPLYSTESVSAPDPGPDQARVLLADQDWREALSGGTGLRGLRRQRC